MKALLSLFVITAFLPLPRAFSQATVSPTVYIDAPAPGATVSGIVKISVPWSGRGRCGHFIF
jgi:hypothetical protein